MVDVSATQKTPEGESSKIKNLITTKPGILKSKFLTVLGNSNELLNRISNKLDINLSLSSSDSEYCDDDEEEQPDETVDFAAIDFDARRVKSRRAHEEIISGRFRHPNLVPKLNQNHVIPSGQQKVSTSSSSESVSTSSQSANNSRPSSSYSHNDSIDSRSPNHGDTDDELKDNIQLVTNANAPSAIDIILPELSEPSSNLNADNSVLINDIEVAGATATLNQQINTESPKLMIGNTPELQTPAAVVTTLNRNIQKTSNSSTLTSLNDPAVPISVSLESSDLRNWIRSESENTVASWASSISLDSHTEESVKEFMKEFIEILFRNSSAIGLELKSEFGLKARQMSGRLWFARFVNLQRSKSKKTDETTFYSLVQYFAIILFECAESEDYSPAKNLMNMCFTFYHEIEVPGCEPYREYLFTYLRQQPIWHTLRFWNAAFFDALQSQRAHRPVPKINNKHKSINKQLQEQQQQQQDHEQQQQHQEQQQQQQQQQQQLKQHRKQNTKNLKNTERNNSLPQSDNDNSLSSATTSSPSSSSSTSSASEHQEDAILCNEIKDDIQFQQNITFGQLGTFTCNMHAFGLSKDLCLDFLKKQCMIANLPKDQEKLLRDNINRMYHETEKWGA